MIIGVPKESFPGERRVALVPPVIPNLARLGCSVIIEHGAGQAAGWNDDSYREKGALIAESREEVFAKADIILQVLCYGANDRTGRDDLRLFRNGQVVIGFLRPLGSPETVLEIAKTGVTAFAIEMMPRITRAQPMDALSSMGAICGYKAVLLAADTLPRLFPMMVTAAGTIPPAKVFVIGAGVAGLQAIATARRLGAVVSAYDIRPAAKEQVESVGGRFVELGIEAKAAEDERGYARAQDESFYRRQQELLASVVAQSDVVITAAVVPGKKAPVLVTRDMVRRMTPGSVIVDLAAERGGNCEATVPNEIAVVDGVTIIGYFNLASSTPTHASLMYARNLSAFLHHLIKQERISIDMEDQITRETLVARDGEVVHPRVRELLSHSVNGNLTGSN